MKIRRVLPPAAAPLGWRDLASGLAGMLRPSHAIRRFTEELRQEFGIKHVFLVSSGTAALALTLQAVRASSRKTSVVIPAYTCFSVVAAVVKAGLKPMPCDIDPVTFDFDHALLKRTVNDDTLCVVAHHLFGIPSDIDRTRALCSARGIAVVEDAAQAMGGTSKGRLLGTIGDAGIFSLGRGKNITSGAGGIVVTNSDTLASAIESRLRQCRRPRFRQSARAFASVAALAVFIQPRLFWIPTAISSLRLGQTIFPDDVTIAPLTGMHAGVLRRWREHLAQANELRSRTTADLRSRLGELAADRAPLPYLRFPILLNSRSERDRLLARSQALGLGLSGAYCDPVDAIPHVRAVSAGMQFPAARRVADTIITLPTHHLVSPQDRQAIEACLLTARSSVRSAA